MFIGVTARFCSSIGLYAIQSCSVSLRSGLGWPGLIWRLSGQSFAGAVLGLKFGLIFLQSFLITLLFNFVPKVYHKRKSLSSFFLMDLELEKTK